MALDEVMPSAEEFPARDDFQSVIEGPEAAYSRKELRDLLRRAIATLRPAYRVVFLLRALERSRHLGRTKTYPQSARFILDHFVGRPGDFQISRVGTPLTMDKPPTHASVLVTKRAVQLEAA